MTAKKVLPKDAERRTVWIGQELWGRITKAALADDRTVSSWIRRVLEAALTPPKK